MLKNSNSNLFKETVGKFIDDAKYDLIFMDGNGDCPSSNDACTDASYIANSGTIYIFIEKYSGSNLEDEALFLHEAIHAEIARYVYRFEQEEDPNIRARMFELLKYYREMEVAEEDINHPYMTLYYINPIASALRKLDDFKYPLEYYKSFAWDGLRDWDVSNLLEMEEAQEYTEYRTIVNEIQI
ncbi:hypothetical protein [Aestuariibaculum sediminum]|uniref:Uncharacterized protein n=1 Tax=Aestuariibaculum sediminum TaxID=2770637 RepID=A0A8J6Q228_9FLAO|nr:hypothetical protein [Aestuariibaculum sediminum]MBD0833332.1 hypothetical protein [Aestuariibaculum sediminum]